jgi:hypothetical protein
MTNRVRSIEAGRIDACEETCREEVCVAREVGTWDDDALWGGFDE